MAWKEQRVARDIKEVLKNPIEGVDFAVDSSDGRSFWVKLSALDGPAKGTTVHLRIELPNNYPSWPPSVRMVSELAHPNVMGGYLCLDMLNGYNQGPHRGWTPAYTLRSLLFQLSTFLLYDMNIDQDHGGSVNRLKYMENRQRSHLSLAAKSAGDDQKDRTGRTGEGGEGGGGGGGGGAGDSGAEADAEAHALILSMADRLDLGALETVIAAMSPEALQKTMRLDPHGMAGITARRAWNTSNGKQCFCTKKTPEDPECTLSIGVNVERYASDGNVRSVSPSTTFVSLEVASRAMTATAASMEMRDAWNERDITHFLPVVLNKAHRPRALSALPRALAAILGTSNRECDVPLDLLHVVGLAMTTLVAEMMTADTHTAHAARSARYARYARSARSGRFLSDAGMETFLHLHHLLVSVAAEHPRLADHAQASVERFVRCPDRRSKQHCPNLGVLFVHMLLVPRETMSWAAIAPALVREMLARNVFHAIKNRSFGTDFAKRLRDPDAQRCARHFEASKIGNKILALQAWFGNTMARPLSADRDQRQRELERIRDTYDTFSGQPTQDALETFYRRFRDTCAISNWKGFLDAVHMGIGVLPGGTPISRFAGVLRQAVRDSADAGYHKPDASQNIPAFEAWSADALPLIVISEWGDRL